MTPADELKKKLEEMGISVGSWEETASGKKPIPPTMQRQRASLLKVKELLERQLKQDREKQAALYETLSRLKHGGGR